jgi:hypothetical protein
MALHIDDLGNNKIHIRKTTNSGLVELDFNTFATFKANVSAKNGVAEKIAIVDLTAQGNSLTANVADTLINGVAASTDPNQLVQDLDFIGSFIGE